MSDTTSLVVRWLCHDLATPIASMLTASELLDDQTPDAEINELVIGGARRLSARLRLVRLALGAADSAMSAAALHRLIAAGLDGMAINWAFSGDADAATAPLVAGSALLVADLNRLRGLTISNQGVATDGPANWPDSVAAALAGAAPQCTRGAVAALLAARAAALGKKLVGDSSGLHWG